MGARGRAACELATVGSFGSWDDRPPARAARGPGELAARELPGRQLLGHLGQAVTCDPNDPKL